ncbi:MAG: class I SAM-dependent methyltransferase [Planctomycetes bacterium]|nr:class I SAM-dependent methyltransferase [Planctomycetota bacterium]
MSKPRRKAVQKYHDRVAHLYDHSYDDAYWQWHDALTWDYLTPHLPRDLGRRVADLGCGTGKWAARLHKSGYHVTCVDISAQMLDQARAKLAEQGGSHRAEFVQADLSDLSALPAGAFACAVAFGEPIGSTDSPVKAMRQIRKLLADDGLLVATFDNRLAAIDFYLAGGDPDELSRFLRDGRTHWLTRDRDERFPIHTVAPRDLAGLAESSGFSVVEVVGKTVLPMRQHRELLADSAARRAWERIEKSLCRDPAAIGRAAHLQVVFRVARA